MLKLFLERPLITGIAIGLALAIVFAISDADPMLGDILGMNLVFPFLVIGIIIGLYGIIAIYKALLPKEPKKRKNIARAMKAKNKP